jgi:hypothetical protein
MHFNVRAPRADPEDNAGGQLKFYAIDLLLYKYFYQSKLGIFTGWRPRLK